MCSCDLIWQAAEHHTHSPTVGYMREPEKKSKTHGLRKKQFKRAEKEGGIVIMMKNYAKQVMHDAVVQHLLTGAQGPLANYPRLYKWSVMP